MITFTVYGIPASQGSKNQFGGESNPRTRPWRAAVTAEAARYFHSPLGGAVHVSVTFVFPRPKKHYRTGKHASELRVDAPKYVSTKPDLDKLQRAIGDSLTGVALRDDSQIASWTVSKEYGPQAQALITVQPLDGLTARTEAA